MPISLEVGRIYFNDKTFVVKEAKQTVNASQDQYNIPSWWNNLFQDKQIICLCQADSACRLYAKEFTFDKSSSIK